MASPWKITPANEVVSFNRIMSEEQEDRLKAELKQLNRITKRDVPVDPSPSDEAYARTIAEDYLKNSEEGEWEDYSGLIADPEVFALKNSCDSDELIAKFLQSQFDDENTELRSFRQASNGQSKITITLGNSIDGTLFEKRELGKDPWNRMEEKAIDGAVVLDEELSSHFTHKSRVSKKEFLKEKKNRKSDRKQDLATAEMGVDSQTRLLLYKWINNHILDHVNGVVSTGKEALILHAYTDPNYDATAANCSKGHLPLKLPEECAIKIFKTTLNEFKQRDLYIKDDYRFKDRYKNQDKTVVIHLWAEKEMHNLKRMQSVGINCPEVVLLRKHVLMLSFIGKDRQAAPKLKDAQLNADDLARAYDEIITIMFNLFNFAKLVHADLSEYNILWYEGKCWIIDVAQSVEPRHPGALQYLMRDCENIVNFFTKRGLAKVHTKEELFEYISTYNPRVLDAAALERIHKRRKSAKDPLDTNDEFPFEMAWEKVGADKKKASAVHQTAQAMQVLSMKCGAEANDQKGKKTKPIIPVTVNTADN